MKSLRIRLHLLLAATGLVSTALLNFSAQAEAVPSHLAVTTFKDVLRVEDNVLGVSSSGLLLVNNNIGRTPCSYLVDPQKKTRTNLCKVGMTYPQAVNATGVVVGGVGRPGGKLRAARWSASRGLRLLRVPSGVRSTVATSINDHDEIIGISLLDIATAPRSLERDDAAFKVGSLYWSPQGKVRVLLPQARGSVIAQSISENGTIGAVRGVRVNAAQFAQGKTYEDFPLSSALALNRHGKITHQYNRETPRALERDYTNHFRFDTSTHWDHEQPDSESVILRRDLRDTLFESLQGLLQVNNAGGAVANGFRYVSTVGWEPTTERFTGLRCDIDQSLAVILENGSVIGSTCGVAFLAPATRTGIRAEGLQCFTEPGELTAQDELIAVDSQGKAYLRSPFGSDVSVAEASSAQLLERPTDSRCLEIKRDSGTGSCVRDSQGVESCSYSYPASQLGVSSPTVPLSLYATQHDRSGCSGVKLASVFMTGSTVNVSFRYDSRFSYELRPQNFVDNDSAIFDVGGSSGDYPTLYTSSFGLASASVYTSGNPLGVSCVLPEN